MEIQDIWKYLRENGVYPEEIWHDINKDLVVSIEWGDWKHGHLYLDHLMKEKGFIKVGETTTGEDGSDCYSADHFYRVLDMG